MSERVTEERAPELTPSELELIAGLVDRTISGEERAAALELISRSPAAYEVFVDSGSILAELESTPRATRRPLMWVGMAAAAGLAGLIGFQMALLNGPPSVQIQQVPTAVVSRPLADGWQNPVWSATRSGSIGDLPVTARGFRIGASWAQLQAAVERGNDPAAESLSRALVTELSDLGETGPLIQLLESWVSGVDTSVGGDAVGELLALWVDGAGRNVRLGYDAGFDVTVAHMLLSTVPPSTDELDWARLVATLEPFDQAVGDARAELTRASAMGEDGVAAGLDALRTIADALSR